MQSIGQTSTQASHSMHKGGGEHGLDVAVEAALRFADRLNEIEAKLDFGLDVLQRHRVLDMGHLKPAIEGDVIVVGPLVDAHFLADEIGQRIGAQARILALAEGVDRDRGLVAVGDRGDDVLRAERGVAAEEDVRQNSTGR